MEDELLDVVNELGDVISTLPRTEIHGNPALLHRVVHVLVFNASGALLLQKRSLNKDVAAGLWDTSVGGHVNAGESLDDAVQREMEEELGIASAKLSFLYSYIHSNAYESELVHTYSCTYDGPVQFQEEEIDEVRPWSIDDIGNAIGKGSLSDNFEHEFALYQKHRSSR